MLRFRSGSRGSAPTLQLVAALAVLLGAGAIAHAQPPAGGPGRQVFTTRCAVCHGADGHGGDTGPSIVYRLPLLSDAELVTLLHAGRPQKGMPPMPMPAASRTALMRFLRGIERREPPLERTVVETTDGRKLDGLVLNQGLDDLQLRTDDQRVHLLRRAGRRFRPVTSDRDWPTYNGDPGGNRYTTLAQIDATNVARLAPRWMFTFPEAGQLQMTPVVVGGIMYVSAPNECYALDAGTGRQIWRYKRSRTQGLTSGHANRGVAVAGDRVFMVTDHAHVIALNRFTGELVWDTAMADWRENYAASSAPLVAGDVVVSGVSGGEHGANGFVVAFSQETGKEVWRFWTVPKPGTPGSETWKGKDIEHGGAPTWFTGSYDPELDLVYWPTGNPGKEYDGTDREGDNLYASCILALDRRSGALKWHYQFTPHDLWDWDATQTSVLIDADWKGQPRKLMLHADRNGFFYVFDRATGERLLSTPFVTNLTWASGIGADGRPIRLPNQNPSPQGTKVCPSQDGATNWYSPAYSPQTGLYYVQTFEKCSIYQTSPTPVWERGRPYLGGSQKIAPDPKPQRILRALDIRTGKPAWELPQAGPALSWGGTLATASGLVFVAEDGGAFMAVDAKDGRPLWSFRTNTTWRSSPMTYQFDGRQFVSIAAGGSIMAFALPEAPGAPATPSATIANAAIRATVDLPDARAGYYRGTRFDWSGSIRSLTWNGHEYFGQWFERYDPTLHDAIMGPVEEFLTGDEKSGYGAVGYTEAAPGGTFVRIGVGVLRRPPEPGLNRFGYQDIVDPGTWTTTVGADRITFVHELKDTTGYAYVYTKTLRLEGETLVLEHELKNTGTKPIVSEAYNHNFFTLDGRVTSPDVVVRFRFEPKADRSFNGMAEIRGREIAPSRVFQRGESTFAELAGFGAGASDYGFEMENRATGAGVRVTGDRALTRQLFWASLKTVCPEPYIDVSVEPGRTSTWRITYAFYEAPKAAAASR
jgi:alcohol dehydrogenase (cytochrome c)